MPTYSARTPAVRPHACPPPTVSTVFLTAIMVSWAEGDDGGSSVTGFTLRPTGGGEAEEVRAQHTPRLVRFWRCNFFAARTRLCRFDHDGRWNFDYQSQHAVPTADFYHPLYEMWFPLGCGEAWRQSPIGTLGFATYKPRFRFPRRQKRGRGKGHQQKGLHTRVTRSAPSAQPTKRERFLILRESFSARPPLTHTLPF